MQPTTERVWGCYYLKERNSDGTAKKTQSNNMKFQLQVSGAAAIYVTAVNMKPNAHPNDSLIALENHLSDIY